MERYLKLQDAIDVIRNTVAEGPLEDTLELRLLDRSLNRDVVEVVRCKDCKYGDVDNADFPNQYLCNHNGCDWNEGNHYCSYGERKEE